jgi:hypothetical protein
MNKKHEKGVTLLELSVYMIVILFVVGIMATISNFFYKNLGVVRSSARYAAQFDIFNSYFIKDVKANNDVNIDTSNTIVFTDGTTYVYKPDNKSIYRGKQKIASNVESFVVSKKLVMVNSVKKNIISVKIIIGNSTKTWFNKTIDYTLKYW